MSRSKYIITGNLKEEQIELDVANYFGIISGRVNKRFRLLCTDELKTGSDKVYSSSRGFLIYLQFKASTGLRSIKDFPSSSRKNRSKLEDVREYRHKQKYQDNPTLYFKLREKSKVKATDYQHNVLLKHANQPNSQAIYVANLEMNKEKYNEILWQSAQLAEHPFYWHKYPPFSFDEIAYQISMVPFLKGHVSIVPTSKVLSAKHYYSYSEIGSNVVFHSPELISQGISNLAEFLKNHFMDIYDRKIETTSIENLYRSTIAKEVFEIVDKNDSVQGLVDYGLKLYKEYRIKQYIIIDQRGESSR